MPDQSNGRPPDPLSATGLERRVVEILRRERPSGMIQRVVDSHEKTPLWLKLSIGTGLVALGGYLIVKTPPTDKLQMAWEGGIVAIGLLVLPGVGKGILEMVRPFVPNRLLNEKNNGKNNGTSGPTGTT